MPTVIFLSVSLCSCRPSQSLGTANQCRFISDSKHQSVAGMFPKNTDWFGTGTSCDVTKPGCRNIDFIKGVGGNNVAPSYIDLRSTCQTKVDRIPQINYNAEEASLRLAIRYARARGLGVTLKPFVLRNDSVLNGWTPRSSKFFLTRLKQC